MVLASCQQHTPGSGGQCSGQQPEMIKCSQVGTEGRFGSLPLLRPWCAHMLCSGMHAQRTAADLVCRSAAAYTPSPTAAAATGPHIIDQQHEPAQERFPSSLSTAAAELEEQGVPPLGSIDRCGGYCRGAATVGSAAFVQAGCC